MDIRAAIDLWAKLTVMVEDLERIEEPLMHRVAAGASELQPLLVMVHTARMQAQTQANTLRAEFQRHSEVDIAVDMAVDGRKRA